MHAGEPSTVRVAPAGFGEGLTLVDARGVWPIRLDHARAVPGCTQLVLPHRVVSTPEHLLAALSGLGITDARVHVDGEELPVLDGAAGAWCAAVVEAGVAYGPPLVLQDPGTGSVTARGGRMAWASGPPERIVHVDFGPEGPRGTARWRPGRDDFVEAVAWARTFVLASQVDALRAAGRGRGATAHNTLVWGRGVPQRPDEPVVHKLLDLVGDLALLGPFGGRIEVWRGSHSLHHAGMSAIAAGNLT